MSAPSAQILKLRRYIWTGAIASVTATGAIYGAGLKERSDMKKKAIHKSYEATFDERLASLENHRGTLIAKRMGIEKKIEELNARKAGATRAESMQGRERR